MFADGFEASTTVGVWLVALLDTHRKLAHDCIVCWIKVKPEGGQVTLHWVSTDVVLRDVLRTTLMEVGWRDILRSTLTEVGWRDFLPSTFIDVALRDILQANLMQVGWRDTLRPTLFAVMLYEILQATLMKIAKRIVVRKQRSRKRIVLREGLFLFTADVSAPSRLNGIHGVWSGDGEEEEEGKEKGSWQ